MRTKIDASRTLLYETARRVDITKSYEALSKVRPLTPEERTDYKLNARMADALTPMLKMMSSEWANQVAYDSIQIHGGSGFMREYPCERMYRDARILTIYEGTSQLQVVAAVKSIGTGQYLNNITMYDEQFMAAAEKSDEQMSLRQQLMDMTAQYNTLYEQARQMEIVPERRLTEMLAYITMGYLLLLDSLRCECFLPSLRNLIAMGRGEMAKHATYIH